MLFYIILIVLMIFIGQFYPSSNDIKFNKKDKIITCIIAILISIFVCSIFSGVMLNIFSIDSVDYKKAKLYKKALLEADNSIEDCKFIINKIEIYNKRLVNLRFWNKLPMLDGFISDGNLNKLEIIKLDYTKIR